jgi:hypothetical protein
MYIDELTGQGLGNVAWAFARFNHHDPRVMQKIADHLRIVNHDVQAIGSVVWAFSRLQLDGFCDQFRPLVLKSNFKNASSKTIGQLLDAFSCHDPGNCVSKHMLTFISDKMISSMDASEIVHLLGCIAKLSYAPKPLCDDIIARTIDVLEQLDAESLGIAASAINRICRLLDQDHASNRSKRKHISSAFRKATKRLCDRVGWRSIGYIEILQRITCMQESKWQQSSTTLVSMLTNKMKDLCHIIEDNAFNRNAQPGLKLSSLHPSPISAKRLLILGDDIGHHLSTFCQERNMNYQHWYRTVTNENSSSTSMWDRIDGVFDGCIMRFPSSIGILIVHILHPGLIRVP